MHIFPDYAFVYVCARERPYVDKRYYNIIICTLTCVKRLFSGAGQCVL